MEERFYYRSSDAPAPNVPILPGAAAVIFDAERRILVLKRTRGPYWSLPGGRMELGESAQGCCIRETREETGLTVVVTRLIGLYTDPGSICAYPDGNVHQSYVVGFQCEVVAGDLTVSEESQRFRWIEQEELETLPLLPDNVLMCRDAWLGRPEAAIR